jgi:hypothetical protein
MTTAADQHRSLLKRRADSAMTLKGETFGPL